MIRKDKGFSLVELMVIVTIFGMFMALGVAKYSQYQREKAINDTRVRRDIVAAALSRYLYNFGALPCPASPSLPAGSPKAGVGDCATVIAQFPSYIQWKPKASCDVNNICVVQGARFTANNPTYCAGLFACGAQPPNSAAYNDPVIIGTLPYVDLGISVNDSVDGWDNRMTYAVSYYLTSDWVNPAVQCTYSTPAALHAFCGDFGVISQENYNAASDAILPTPNPGLSVGAPGVINSYMLAVVSHGQYGKGAWNYNGVQKTSCDMTPIDTGAGSGLSRMPGSTGRDNENCNGDAVFLSNGNEPWQNLTSRVHGPNFYDNGFVLTDINAGNEPWRLNQAGNQLENKSGGFVGINTSLPTQPLDVAGNIQANNIQSDNYCDSATGNCFQQTLLSPGLTCNNGLMTGIAGSAPLCQTAVSLSGLKPAKCSSSQYMTGIDKNGNPTCGAP